MSIAPSGVQHARCPLARCGALLQHHVQPGGAVVTRCPRCERRRAGICRDCSRPVAGTVGKAVRCEACAVTARRAAAARWIADPENRAKKNARTRKRMRSNQAARARKRVTRRAWKAAHPEKVRQYKRRYLLRQSPTYLETQRRHNATPERQAKKREQARQRYYERHPERPTTPTCAACGEPIASWIPGRGRPPKYHAEHSPWRTPLTSARRGDAQAVAA